VSYVGRFAPSPTGPLHFGSLSAAFASYLDARSAAGEWLVRIEDIDPPREVEGAAPAILRTLQTFGLEWDGPVVYQSSRLEAYREACERLLERKLAFRCSCTRAELRRAAKGTNSARYPGTCRQRVRHARRTAVRVRVGPGVAQFTDRVQAARSFDLEALTGDYLIYRRDGLPAYHLAVVVDDAAQGVTDVVRGCDLLESTGTHVHLQQLLELGRPRYAHMPIVTDGHGRKLSKQTGACGVDVADPSAVATEVLGYLGYAVPPELLGAPPRELLNWAVSRWDLGRFRLQTAIPQRVGVVGTRQMI
jgi:glutamyl-Q tRNA(Asp) synthetase